MMGMDTYMVSVTVTLYSELNQSSDQAETGPAKPVRQSDPALPPVDLMLQPAFALVSLRRFAVTGSIQSSIGLLGSLMSRGERDYPICSIGATEVAALSCFVNTLRVAPLWLPSPYSTPSLPHAEIYSFASFGRANLRK